MRDDAGRAMRARGAAAVAVWTARGGRVRGSARAIDVENAGGVREAHDSAPYAPDAKIPRWRTPTPRPRVSRDAGYLRRRLRRAPPGGGAADGGRRRAALHAARARRPQRAQRGRAGGAGWRRPRPAAAAAACRTGRRTAAWRSSTGRSRASPPGRMPRPSCWHAAATIPDALARLEGSFVAAVWDAGRGRLVLVNDRFGLRNLYYAITDGCLVFAPLVGPLCRLAGVDADARRCGRGGRPAPLRARPRHADARARGTGAAAREHRLLRARRAARAALLDAALPARPGTLVRLHGRARAASRRRGAARLCGAGTRRRCRSARGSTRAPSSP